MITELETIRLPARALKLNASHLNAARHRVVMNEQLNWFSRAFSLHRRRVLSATILFYVSHYARLAVRARAIPSNT